MADIMFRFLATCLKMQGLSEVEKMDRFVCMLVPKVRLQVDLRDPLNFYEVAMYAEHADTMIAHISGQDMCKPW